MHGASVTPERSPHRCNSFQLGPGWPLCTVRYGCGDTKRVFLYVFQGWKKGLGIRPMMDAVLSMRSCNQTKLGGRSLSVQLSLSHHLKHH